MQSEKLVHTDISPRNILQKDGRFSVIDLGLYQNVGDIATVGGRDLLFAPSNMLLAPSNMLLEEPLSSMDDCETLAYSLLSFNDEILPWTQQANEDDVYEVGTLK